MSQGAPEMEPGQASWLMKSSKLMAFQLRLWSAVQLLVGLGYIALACVLIWPPIGSALAV